MIVFVCWAKLASIQLSLLNLVYCCWGVNTEEFGGVGILGHTSGRNARVCGVVSKGLYGSGCGMWLQLAVNTSIRLGYGLPTPEGDPKF